MKPTWVVKHFQNTIKRKKVQQIPDPFLLYLLFLSTILRKTSYLILGSMQLNCVSKNVTPLKFKFFSIYFKWTVRSIALRICMISSRLPLKTLGYTVQTSHMEGRWHRNSLFKIQKRPLKAADIYIWVSVQEMLFLGMPPSPCFHRRGRVYKRKFSLSVCPPSLFPSSIIQ